MGARKLAASILVFLSGPGFAQAGEQEIDQDPTVDETNSSVLISQDGASPPRKQVESAAAQESHPEENTDDDLGSNSANHELEPPRRKRTRYGVGYEYRMIRPDRVQRPEPVDRPQRSYRPQRPNRPGRHGR